MESIAGILDRMHRDPNFMFFKRAGIISRAIDAIATKDLEDFGYLPTEGYIILLKTTKLMTIGTQAV